MSGTPTQTEIETQWANGINVLEHIRALADTDLAGNGGLWDTLLQSVKGEYTPVEMANFAARTRQGISNLIGPDLARQVITACLFEFGRLWNSQPGAVDEGFGAGYRTPQQLWRALYEWFIQQSQTVESRDITFGTPTAQTSASNTGNGTVARLTVDENNQPMEACTVERKMIRCRQDSSTGVQAGAEVFELIGDASSFDNVLRSTLGSGSTANAVLYSRHAGSGNGGSLLNNGSFASFSSSSTPKFTGWTETANGGQLSQSTSVTYRAAPGQDTAYSLAMDGTAGTVTITQPLTSMRRTRLNPDQPYFLRIMVNGSAGSASGGTIEMTLGGATAVSTTIASLSAGWNEIILPIDQNCWFRNFNTDDLSLTISWDTPTSGSVYIADAIFCPLTFVDGTYWLIRQNNASPVNWRVDDLFTAEDTDADGPAGAKIQYWNYISGFGYLPSTTGVPTFTEPT